MKWSLATFAVCIALGVQADNIVLKNDNFLRQLYGWNTPSYWAGKRRRSKKTAKNIFSWNPAHAALKYSDARSDTANRSTTLPARRFRFSCGQKATAKSPPVFLPMDSIRELPFTSPAGKNS